MCIRDSPSGCPGGRAPHYWLDDKVSLYDKLDEGFNLLCFTKTKQSILNKFEFACKKYGIPFNSIKIEEAGIRDLYKANYVIIRPDHHVGWRGNEIPQDIDIIMGTLTGHFLN